MYKNSGFVSKLNNNEGIALAVGVLSVAVALYNKFSIYGIVSVTVGFLLHEMSHRYFARRSGCMSRFVLDDFGLLITLISSVLPFGFLAPGYVSIYCFGLPLTKRAELSISASGVVTNIILSSVGLLLGSILNNGFLFVFSAVNSWLALFNLIPIGPFDGAKVFSTSKKVWLLLFLLALFLFIYG